MKIKKIQLHWQILIALVAALLFGIFLPEQIKYISWLGDVFMRGLKMVVVPLVVTSIISGVSNMGSAENFGRLGGKTLLYYMVTSLLAILTGLFLVNIIKPGVGVNIALPASSLVIEKKSFADTLLEIIPVNFFESLVTGNMMAIILFSLLFGYFITQVKPNQQKLLTGFFNGAFEVMMKIINLVIKFAPFGIFGIVAKVVAEQNNLISLFQSLGWFVIVVVVGLLLHFFGCLPLIMWLFGRINFLKHFKAVSAPLLTAFSTSSSNATLPLTMEAIEKNSKVSNKISSFVLPLGATINMDGTALYELVVAGFIAQIYGIDLSLGAQIILVFTALLASIGTAAVPMASMVTMSIVFTAVGLPIEAIAIILPVDRILDMLRTTTNVWSDTCGAVIIAKSEGEVLSY